MLETIRNLGPIRLITIAGVLAGVVGFFFFLMTRLTAPDMALLYNDLSTSDSGRIVSKLESMNVPYELRGNGTTIMVPNDQVLRLRMSMAQEGLPAGGTIGYEIFDKSESLGTSSFVLNINHLRALEGELSRTIGSLAYVRSARVHLALPRRELFQRDQQEPTASVVLQMNGGRRLDKSEVAAIQNLVAAAVPRLKPARISIVDAQGTLLARGQDGDPATAGNGAQSGDEARIAYETRAVRMVEDMLERILGAGRARVEVSAEMDFDRISTTSEKYDPDGQVVRSTQTVAENSNSKEAGSQTVSVQNNIPGQTPPSEGAGGTANASNRNEETVNYEISRTTQTHVRETGSVKRLSVAVAVDGNYDAQKTYQPRSAEDLAQLGRLVKSAVGFDEKRGDSFEIANMRFAGNGIDEAEGPRPLFGLDKNDYIRIAEMVTLGIVGILVILLVVRPIVRRFLEALPDAIASSTKMIAETTAAATAALPGSMPSGMGGMLPAMGGDAGALGEATIDMQQVEGRVRESSVKKISEIVDKHPEEAVNILRNWMYRDN
ncbi:MAG TPA: flagellar basal-body MS-ring/collar protein FliF [Alphaproteobacteria bacterium]|nr:flagellar basal-body MS-ring/collar protein FliF [Alphaproteobacteria bacterium]